MNICFVSDSYPSERPFGGIGIYTHTIAHGLAARGHSVHILVRGQWPTHDLVDAGVHIHFVQDKPTRLLGRIFPEAERSYDVAHALRALQQRFHFDVIEFPNFEGVGLVAEWMRLAPVVVRLHTSTAESVEAAQRPPTFRERITMWTELFAVRRADALITHSLAHRNRMFSAYGVEEIAVVPHGVQIPAVPRPEPARPMVLTLGRLRARKGGPELLAAIPQVLAECPDTQFVSIGSTEEYPLVQEFRTEHPDISPEQVSFRGFVSDTELEDLYSRATVYASPSVYESFGLTFVEALAREIPVVGCNTSAMPETISHEETGLLVPPHDASAFAKAIVRLLRNPELRAKMGTRGRKVALERYTVARMAADIDAFFSRVIAGLLVSHDPGQH